MSSDGHEQPEPETGVRATRAYSADPCPADVLPFALFMALLALVPFAIDDASALHIFCGVILFIASAAMTAYAVYRRFVPSAPMYVLSPRGIELNLSKRTRCRIPWSEIQEIGRASPKFFFPSLVRPRTIHFTDVTTVLVPRRFYDAHIHIPSAFMRGPGWKLHFITHAETVEVAIHHEAIGEPKNDLRREIESRWQTFRAVPSQEKSSSVPEIPFAHFPAPLAKPCDVFKSGWPKLTAIGVLAPAVLVLAANVFGLWETSAQRTSREQREAWRKKIEAEDRKAAEERRQQDEFWKKFWQKSGEFPRSR